MFLLEFTVHWFTGVCMHWLLHHLQTFSYSVKLYNPVRRSKFTWRDLHNITHKFESVATLCSTLYHELEDDVPDSRDFSVGYFEQKKKEVVGIIWWPWSYVCMLWRKTMHFTLLWWKGSRQWIIQWWRKRETLTKKSQENRQPKLNEREDKLESTFQQLRKKHGNNHRNCS